GSTRRSPRLTTRLLPATRPGLPGLQHLGSATDAEHQRLAPLEPRGDQPLRTLQAQVHLPPAPLDAEAERRPPGRQVRIEAQPILAQAEPREAGHRRLPQATQGRHVYTAGAGPSRIFEVDGGRLAKITL